MVRCAEDVACPRCGGKLSPYGTRDRICKKLEQTQWIRIRCLHCSKCGSTHRELPDFLTPYKHYETAVIEQTVRENAKEIEVDVEESTILRWKAWYARIQTHFDQCIASLRKQLVPEGSPSVAPSSAHQENGHIIGRARPMLSQIVRVIVNGNFWSSTQLACLSTA